jgi:hypothetical protein
VGQLAEHRFLYIVERPEDAGHVSQLAGDRADPV